MQQQKMGVDGSIEFLEIRKKIAKMGGIKDNLRKIKQKYSSMRKKRKLKEQSRKEEIK